ncbi:hypothetical protein ABZ387_04325 [Streptomyces flaveolus]|uniref:cyanobactin maturation protease PatG family protein n=1 Tax=Streptomyces flaveolus TaxID=67297 RepID=UPI0033E22740
MDEPIFNLQEAAAPDAAASSESPTSNASHEPDGERRSGCDGSCVGHGSTASEDTETLGASGSQYVYAIGRIDARIPNLGIEKEIAQAMGRSDTVNLTDRQALFQLLSEPHNRYLARQMCYVLQTQGVETFIVLPRDPVDYGLLIESVGTMPRETDLQVVIGMRGPIAPPSFCNGLSLPLVAFDQIYSFDADSLVRSLPKPESVEEGPFRDAAEELFRRVIQIADNAGSSDEHRALNYLAVRYPQIYVKSAESFTRDKTLTSIETQASRLSGARKILQVIFSYTDRKTDVTEKLFVRVDVTEEFPFLVTKLSPYYDR